MQRRIAVYTPSPEAWITTVLANFDTFLKDHADCERKASAMATSLIAKYGERTEIVMPLMETAIEELEHFRDVYALMHSRNILLNKEIKEDVYIKNLISICRTGREERFMDRLLLGSVVECRGAERFRLIYEHIKDAELKTFYHRLWASEAKHGEIFVHLALKYFDSNVVYKRLDALMIEESKILLQLPIRSALH